MKIFLLISAVSFSLGFGFNVYLGQKEHFNSTTEDLAVLSSASTSKENESPVVCKEVFQEHEPLPLHNKQEALAGSTKEVQATKKDNSIEKIFENFEHALKAHPDLAATLSGLLKKNPSAIQQVYESYGTLDTFEKRAIVIDSIAKINDANAKDFFIEQIEMNNSDFEKLYMIESLYQTDLLENNEELINLVSETALVSGSEDVVFSSLYTLSKIESEDGRINQEAVMLASIFQSSENDEVKGQALRILAESGGEPEKNNLEHFIEEGLRSEDEIQRLAAIDLIYSVKNVRFKPSLTDEIEKIVLDRTIDPDTRSFALSAIGRLQENESDLIHMGNPL